MRRRTLVRAVGASVLAASSGCLSAATLGSETTPTTEAEATPEPSTRREADGLTAVVGDASYTGTAGDDESVTGSFECEAATGTLRGRLSTNSCRTVAISELSFDPGAGTARLVLYPKWDEESPPGEIDCAGATYEYRVRLEATDELPEEIEVVHERPDGDPSRFSLVSGC